MDGSNGKNKLLMYPYKIFITILFYNASMSAQEYTISLWSIPVAQVEMNNNKLGEIHFNTESVGIIDYIWPHKNSYSTFYNKENFGLRKYSKKIKQGDFKQKMSWEYNLSDSALIHEDTKISTSDSIQTIFTMLARVTLEPYNYLDTKWFMIDHESCLHKGRFLWSDTIRVTALDKEILCDHFRLDLKKIDQNDCGIDESDYFMKNIIDDNSVRQIWVEKNNNKRIIKASVKVYGFPLEAIIINE